MQRRSHAPCCTQRHAFARPTHAYAKARAITHQGFNLLTQPGMVNHQICKACRTQAFNLPHNQRFSMHALQGFGDMVCKGAHALAAPGRQNHGLAH